MCVPLIFGDPEHFHKHISHFCVFFWPKKKSLFKSIFLIVVLYAFTVNSLSDT